MRPMQEGEKESKFEIVRKRYVADMCDSVQPATLGILSKIRPQTPAVVSPREGNAGLIHLEARDVAKEIGSLF